MNKTWLFGGAIALFAIAAPAQATEFIGGTTGCFYTKPGQTTCTANQTTTTINGLTFTGGATTFDVFSDPSGYASIGAGQTLGTFSLVPNPTGYANDFFNLLVTFAAPPGTSAGSDFTALLKGSLTTNTSTGGVGIHFSNNTQTFTDAAGELFTLTVNDINLNVGPNGTFPVTAEVQGSIQLLPEPATWAMMILGFAGVGFVMRRKNAASHIAQIA